MNQSVYNQLVNGHYTLQDDLWGDSEPTTMTEEELFTATRNLLVYHWCQQNSQEKLLPTLPENIILETPPDMSKVTFEELVKMVSPESEKCYGLK